MKDTYNTFLKYSAFSRMPLMSLVAHVYFAKVANVEQPAGPSSLPATAKINAALTKGNRQT